MGYSVYNTSPRDTAGATRRNYSTQKSVVQNKNLLQTLKTVSKTTEKTTTQIQILLTVKKTGNAGHVKTGLTKLLIPRCDF